MLNERKLYLEKLVDRLSKRIEAAPQGSLRINTSNNKKQFFWRKEPGDKDGMYIPRKQFPMAQALAQKDYDKKVLKSIWICCRLFQWKIYMNPYIMNVKR